MMQPSAVLVINLLQLKATHPSLPSWNDSDLDLQVPGSTQSCQSCLSPHFSCFWSEPHPVQPLVYSWFQSRPCNEPHAIIFWNPAPNPSWPKFQGPSRRAATQQPVGCLSIGGTDYLASWGLLETFLRPRIKRLAQNRRWIKARAASKTLWNPNKILCWIRVVAELSRRIGQVIEHPIDNHYFARLWKTSYANDFTCKTCGKGSSHAAHGFHVAAKRWIDFQQAPTAEPSP